MSEHELLYRKYRPRRYADVIGQEHITSILKGLVIRKSYQHIKLMIFGGTAGGGKTTLARIYSMAVNCKSPNEGEPCLECDRCLAFLNKNYPDFIEIDGASHRGVGDIEKIKDIASRFTMVEGGYRVILVDEAHQLSTTAQDSLLLMMEEGNQPTVLLFATTEPSKIRDALLSRAFDFRIKPLSSTVLLSYLKFVCDKEVLEYEESALNLISQIYKGRTRDALKYIDTYRMTGKALKNISFVRLEDRFAESLRFLFDKDIEKALEILDDTLYSEGSFIEALHTVLTELVIYPFKGYNYVTDIRLLDSIKGVAVTDFVKSFLDLKPVNIEGVKLFYTFMFGKINSISDELTGGGTNNKLKLRKNIAPNTQNSYNVEQLTRLGFEEIAG